MSHEIYFLIAAATIGEVTMSQPATKAYPILPSAPPQDFPQQPQSYGTISEVITSQPVDNIAFVGACPICRIGKQSTNSRFKLLFTHEFSHFRFT